MTQTVVNELADAFKSTIGLLRDSIRNFDDAHWRKGATFFQVPAKVAYHSTECLDYYFTTTGRDEWVWGYRFGAPWWELSDEDQPSQQDLIAYLDELEERIARRFAGAQDETLGEVYDPKGENASDRLATRPCWTCTPAARTLTPRRFRWPPKSPTRGFESSNNAAK